MTYSAEQRETAIKAVIEGLRVGTPLAVVCRGEGMPCDDTVRIWAENEQELSRAIARAREAGWDYLAQEALDIADEVQHDTIKGENGDERPNNEWISRSKLRVETRLKLLAKWDPKRYGDLVKIGNPDGSNLAETMDDTAVAVRVAAILQTALARDEPQ